MVRVQILWYEQLTQVRVNMHCKKIVGWFNPRMSSQLQSRFIQVQVVVHLLCQGFAMVLL